jgi:hypothetical protein
VLGFALNSNPTKKEYADNSKRGAAAVKQAKAGRKSVEKGPND